MANTGAPYFIPYVEPTDLVRDYPAADEASADAIAAALDAIPVLAGIGSNVLQTVKTNAFTTTSTTFVDVTGFTVTITPTSATSKVLVVADYAAGNSAGSSTFTRLLRNSTAIADPTHFYGHFGSERNRDRPYITAVFLDSPSTTSATTYKLQIRATGATAFFNRDAASTTAVCSITAIEVAA